MNAPRIDLLPENDRTNGWAAHLPLRTLRPPGTGGTSQVMCYYTGQTICS